MNIVADASAILAVLLSEPDAQTYEARLLTAPRVWMSPINWWEVQVRMRSRYGDAGENAGANWMTEAGIVIEPITARHAELALEAHAKYRGRPAKLNMGDCFAYALASAKDVPLLYKGKDFAGTDLHSL